MSSWTYQERYVRCGKAACRKCSRGAGHGPYWYGYIHERGRMRTKYFGKNHPEGEDGARRWRAYSQHRAYDRPAATPPPPPQSRWSHSKRITYAEACRIFGIPSIERAWKPLGRYRALMDKHHPDHGGSHEAAVAINLAYRFIQDWLRA